MVSKPETIKDTIQVVVESGATHVGRIATIITTAVRDVAREIGEFATDVFEMAENAERASKADAAKRDRDEDSEENQG